jgi:hypothetical protein
MKQGGSITHIFSKLGVVFLSLQKRKNELNSIHIYVRMLEIPKSYLNIFYTCLTLIKVIVCHKQLMS